jgi:hypothetical protein
VFSLTDTLGGMTPVNFAQQQRPLSGLVQNTGTLLVYKLDGRVVRRIFLGGTQDHSTALKGLSTLLSSGTYAYRVERGVVGGTPSVGFVTIR